MPLVKVTGKSVAREGGTYLYLEGINDNSFSRVWVAGTADIIKIGDRYQLDFKATNIVPPDIPPIDPPPIDPPIESGDKFRLQMDYGYEEEYKEREVALDPTKRYQVRIVGNVGNTEGYPERSQLVMVEVRTGNPLHMRGFHYRTNHNNLVLVNKDRNVDTFKTSSGSASVEITEQSVLKINFGVPDKANRWAYYTPRFGEGWNTTVHINEL